VELQRDAPALGPPRRDRPQVDRTSERPPLIPLDIARTTSLLCCSRSPASPCPAAASWLIPKSAAAPRNSRNPASSLASTLQNQAASRGEGADRGRVSTARRSRSDGRFDRRIHLRRGRSAPRIDGVRASPASRVALRRSPPARPWFPSDRPRRGRSGAGGPGPTRRDRCCSAGASVS
jgi:hypothetical protein